MHIISPEKHKVWFPIELLPKEFHKEPYKDFNGTCVNVPLSVAMHYRKDKVPYVLSVSADLY